MSNFQNMICVDSLYIAISSIYLQMSRSGAAYAMGSALYLENWGLFIRLWNEGIVLLQEYYPDQPIYPYNIAGAISDNNIPLVISSDGTLSIAV